MKKDKKFLNDLDQLLISINKKDRNAIVLKYTNIIEEELNNKKRIKNIIKDLGTPEEVALREIKLLNNNKKGLSKLFKVKIKEKKEPKEKKKKKSISKKKSKKSKKKNLNIKKLLSSIKEFFTKERIFKKKEKTKKPVEVIEDIIEEAQEEIVDVTEIVTEKKIFESARARRKRIILKTLGIILITLLLFVWLWITVIFIATIVAFLDGVRLIGLVISMFGIDILILWIIIIINKTIFKKNNNLKINLIIIIGSVVLIALGIVLSIKEIVDIESVEDVSEKYSMSTKYDVYSLPSDENIKMNILFNSNYDTQYIINYDDNLDGKVKVEVKYYECYYDYYVKKASNSIYISLKKDVRDRLSAYINDIKDNKIYASDELARYTVKITVNEKDYGRLVIQN